LAAGRVGLTGRAAGRVIFRAAGARRAAFGGLLIGLALVALAAFRAGLLALVAPAAFRAGLLALATLAAALAGRGAAFRRRAGLAAFLAADVFLTLAFRCLVAFFFAILFSSWHFSCVRRRLGPAGQFLFDAVERE